MKRVRGESESVVLSYALTIQPLIYSRDAIVVDEQLFQSQEARESLELHHCVVRQVYAIKLVLRVPFSGDRHHRCRHLSHAMHSQVTYIKKQRETPLNNPSPWTGHIASR